MYTLVLAIAGLGVAFTCVHGGFIEVDSIRLKRDELGGIRYTRLADTHMIDSTDTAYAIASPELSRFDWLTVAVNGSEAVLYTSNCKQISKQLSPAELAFVEGLRAGLFNESANNELRSEAKSVQYVSTNHIKVSDIGGDRLRTASCAMLHYMEEGRLSVAFSTLPDGLHRVLALENLIGFAYWDNRVQLKPLACLDSTERERLDKLLLNMIEAEGAFKRYQDKLNSMGAELSRLAADDLDSHESEIDEKMDQRYKLSWELESTMMDLDRKFSQEMSIRHQQ